MLLDKLGIKIQLKDHFSVIRESLDRIGIANKDKKILNPSCYILHKQGEYYIIHFKQLLALDGKQTNFSEEDQIRTVSIAFLLQKWGLIEIENPEKYQDVENTFVFVLPFNDKSNWKIIHKYQVGVKK